MAEFRVGDEVELITRECRGYTFVGAKIGDRAIVEPPPRDWNGEFIWIRWRQPNTQCDGGYRPESFVRVSEDTPFGKSLRTYIAKELNDA